MSEVFRARALATVLAVATVVGGIVVAVPTARAPLTGLTVPPGAYTGTYVYVPGETITFTITSNTAGEVYDAVIAKVSTAQTLAAYNNVTIPTGLSLTMTYTVPANLPDNAVNDYRIEIGNQNYIENGRVGLLLSRRFSVQAYRLAVEVDRPAYLGGDSVIVTWSARNVRDGALAPLGYGQIWVFDTRGTSLISPSPYVFSAPSGTYAFRLPDLADPRYDGQVLAWFNDSASNPIRFQQAVDTFNVAYLSVLVTALPVVTAPGSVEVVEVHTVATNNQAAPAPTDPDEPGMHVDVSVWEIPPPPGAPIERTQYGATNLVTDAHGELTYPFTLDSGIADGTEFEVRANATHPNGIWTWQGRDTFTVRVGALSQILQLDRSEYQAGDTATALSIVSGTGPFTYTFEVRDTSSATCSAAGPTGLPLVLGTQTTNSFAYAIPPNFAGRLCFRVTVEDGQGGRVTSARAASVVFGWLTLVADRQEYAAGDTVTVSWTLLSNRINSPTYFYQVTDAEGNLAASGTTGAARSTAFVVPNPPSASYTFLVIASQDGRAVVGSLTVRKVAGFLLGLTFDPSFTYVPGGTLVVHYELRQRAPDVPYPSSLLLQYGLANAPPSTLATSQTTGTLTFAVPAGIDEGPQLFAALESSTNTQAIEVVTIDGTAPIVGTPFADSAVTGVPISVRVNASDNVALASVELHWTASDGTNGTLPMDEEPGGVYAASVPPLGSAGTLDVYVSARDVAGNTARSPVVRVLLVQGSGTGGNPPTESLTAVDLAVLGVAIVALVLSALSLLRRRGARTPGAKAPKPPTS